MNLPYHIKKIANISPEDESDVIPYFKKEELPKGHFLFRQGEVCRHLFYVENGMARVYYYANNGKEITAWFSGDNTFITAIDSFYQHTPTRDYCQLLEDSVVYSLRYADMESVLNKNHSMARFAFHALYEIAKKMTEFISSTKFQSAEDRYKALMQEYPSIFQRASLGHIASYLGITQETLSRIRAAK